MSKKLVATAVACGALALAACAGHYGTGGANGANTSSIVLPNMPDLQIKVTLPDGKTGAISEELPSEGLGTIDDSYWGATVGGFTQQTYSQTLGFPPGTQLTITNISKNITHTLNVVKKIKGPPAKFPSSPTLSDTPSGGKLQKGYASGSILPGKSVTVTLGKSGIYLIGCYFHYADGMRDVLVVSKTATPGPQATPPAK